MKYSQVSKFIGAGVLAASLAVIPSHLPAQAQTGTQAPTYETQPNEDLYETTETDRDFDWGWLGLLGLIGLAGLAKRSEPVRYRDVDREPDVTGSSRYNR